VPIALWRFRTGDIEGAVKLLQAAYRPEDHDSLTTTVRVLLALCARQRGDHVQAESLRTTAFKDISANFAYREKWYDWAFVRILLKEADSLRP
jgi:hypothetical protein